MSRADPPDPELLAAAARAFRPLVTPVGAVGPVEVALVDDSDAPISLARTYRLTPLEARSLAALLVVAAKGVGRR